MLGIARLTTFSVRALALLILISILWVSIAKPYNEILSAFAQPFAPESIAIDVLGTDIRFMNAESVPLEAIDGLTLHYGLILLATVVLAAVGVRILPRIGWLFALMFATFIAHVIGVVLLSHGASWIVSSNSPAESSRLTFSLFAVSWGLLPALAGGVWCFFYWRPAVSKNAQYSDRPENSQISLSSS